MMQIQIVSPTPGAPAGKLADAELVFLEGALAGLKLVGFSVWEGRDGRGRTVSLPARHYTVNGERRHYVLLRALDDGGNTDLLRDQILRAYADHEDAPVAAAGPDGSRH